MPSKKTYIVVIRVLYYFITVARLVLYYKSMRSNPLQVLFSAAVFNLILDGIVTGLPNLGLEVEIDQLILFGVPLSIGITVINDLAAASITNLDSGVGDGSICSPLNAITAVGLDGEWLGAADVAFSI